MGTIRLKIGIYILENENVLYVPRLDDSLFSIMKILSITIVHLLEITTNTRYISQTFLFLQGLLVKYSFHMNTYPITTN